MTPEELDHIRTTTNNATPGPWLPSDFYNEVTPIMDLNGTIIRPEDSTFIANARSWIPQLLDYIQELKVELDGEDADYEARQEALMAHPVYGALYRRTQAIMRDTKPEDTIHIPRISDL